MSAGGDWRRLPVSTVVQRARVETILNLALEGRLPDLTNGARFFQNPQIVADRASRGEVSEGLVNFGGTGPSAVIGAHSFYVEARSGAGRGSRSVTPASPSRSPSSSAAWSAAGGAIFVGENRIEAMADTPMAPGSSGAGQGPVRLTQVIDPGRAIFVVGPGLAVGSDQ
jgi:hypothetical protein